MHVFACEYVNVCGGGEPVNMNLSVSVEPPLGVLINTISLVLLDETL